jgi:hypothetical protein
LYFLALSRIPRYDLGRQMPTSSEVVLSQYILISRLHTTLLTNQMCRRSTNCRYRHRSRQCRHRHYRRRSPCRWCHHYQSRVAGHIPPRKRPPPLMRRSHRCHRRRRHCSCRMPVASTTSPWTPNLLRHRTCTCSPLNPLDYNVKWNLISYKC